MKNQKEIESKLKAWSDSKNSNILQKEKNIIENLIKIRNMDISYYNNKLMQIEIEAEKNKNNIEKWDIIIKSVLNETEYNILYYRFIKKWQWEQIARKLNYSLRQIYVYRKKILDKLQDLL
ncbi:MAG: sigma-70 family RNA polymerase sigma factor [Methanobrevibacter sp.]|nr:sigma-70 family RNA polymerase sigma factor [Methanobrevibacter sp.]